jgi:oligopeptide/dipeptide ABC transporter ATP-binding protein
VIVAANDDMALGAMEAVKARGLTGIAIIGFDALPEALARLPAGCAFRDRCPRAMAVCASVVPPLVEAASAGHALACHAEA